MVKTNNKSGSTNTIISGTLGTITKRNQTGFSIKVPKNKKSSNNKSTKK